MRAIINEINARIAREEKIAEAQRQGMRSPTDSPAKKLDYEIYYIIDNQLESGDDIKMLRLRYLIADGRYQQMDLRREQILTNERLIFACQQNLIPKPSTPLSPT